MTTAARALIQTCIITDWRPTINPNGGTPHRMVQKKRHDIDSGTAWATAKHAGWKFVPGKVRLTITLVYSKRPVPDKDNAYARCKGVIDGLRLHVSPWVKPRPTHPTLRDMIGFFQNDDDLNADIIVETLVEPGKKEVRLVLESISEAPSVVPDAAGQMSAAEPSRTGE